MDKVKPCQTKWRAELGTLKALLINLNFPLHLWLNSFALLQYKGQSPEPLTVLPNLWTAPCLIFILTY